MARQLLYIYPIILGLTDYIYLYICLCSLPMSLRRDDDASILFNTFQGGALQGRAECADNGLKFVYIYIYKYV